MQWILIERSPSFERSQGPRALPLRMPTCGNRKIDGGGPGPETGSLLWRIRRSPPASFIEPCLPSPAERPSSGPDGFRLMVRREPAGVRLLTRNGID